MARPRIPVLVGTVALLAGCGSQTRVEVSGVVRDGETGRVIANALIVGADGSSTRTDTNGRFSLFVRSDERRSIRASALLHEDGVAYFDPHEGAGDDAMAFALTPLHEPARIEEDDPDAVLRWLREAWLDDRDALDHADARDTDARDTDARDTDARDDDLDAAVIDGTQGLWSWSRDAIASLDREAFEVRGARVAIAHAGTTACGACHATDAAMVGTAVAGALTPMSSTGAHADPPRAPHASLEGGCLACHGERAADGLRARRGLESDLEPARCSGCHAGMGVDVGSGDLRSADLRALRAPALEATARAEAAFARAVAEVTECGHTAAGVARIDGVLLLLDPVGLPLGDCDASGAIDGSEVAIGLEVLDPRIARAAEDLALLRADRSRGVHQPALTRALAERVERALH